MSCMLTWHTIVITKNIVAMGFPAEGREGIYRNHMKDVKRFAAISVTFQNANLDSGFTTHTTRTTTKCTTCRDLAFNLYSPSHPSIASGVKKETTTLQSSMAEVRFIIVIHAAACSACISVIKYPFVDHNAPPFPLMGAFCEDVDNYLKEDER